MTLFDHFFDGYICVKFSKALTSSWKFSFFLCSLTSTPTTRVLPPLRSCCVSSSTIVSDTSTFPLFSIFLLFLFFFEAFFPIMNITSMVGILFSSEVTSLTTSWVLDSTLLTFSSSIKVSLETSLMVSLLWLIRSLLLHFYSNFLVHHYGSLCFVWRRTILCASSISQSSRCLARNMFIKLR